MSIKTAYVYAATLTPDAAGRFTVAFRDLPEALTDGAKIDAAMAEASDCLSTALSGRIVRGEEILQPSRPRKGEISVTPDSTVALKAALNKAMRESNTHVRKFSDMLLTFNHQAGASAPLVRCLRLNRTNPSIPLGASLAWARGPAIAGLRI